MTWTLGTIRRGIARLGRTRVVLLGVIGTLSSTLAGCGALDVSNPTAIEERELNDAAGANLLRGAVLRVLAEATHQAAYYGGLLADEFLFDPQSTQFTSEEERLDRREGGVFGSFSFNIYDRSQQVRFKATVALPKLRAYAPAGAAEARVGEMFALRAFAALRLAEDFCPGFPLNDLVDYKLVLNPPLSTEAALARGLADFDSAVAYAADSTRILHFAQVGRARALLQLGRFAEAGAAVTGVPTVYVAQAEYRASISPPLRNMLAFGQFGDLSRSVADREGGTGPDFVTANDPRVRLTRLGTARNGTTGIYRSNKYPNPDAPIVLASGIEARLIEAEAALRARPNDLQWLTILNALRADFPDTALSNHPLTDPGTEPARVDLLFRERAFWLFATGHRLGDLRRLVRVYGRPVESVFPTGTYRLGGTYATATSIAFPATQQGGETLHNPAVTGCTSF